MRYPYLRIISQTGEELIIGTHPGDSSYLLLKDGTTGLFAADIDLKTHSYPDYNRVSEWRPSRRITTMKILIVGDNDTDLLQKYNTLVRVVEPRPDDANPLTIRFHSVLRPEGRDLLAHYRGGLQTPDEIIIGANTSPNAIVTASFIAHNPYWHATAASVLQFKQGAAVPFLPLTLPFTLAPDAVIGSAVIYNAGDHEAYPIWQIYGPGNDLLIEHTESGDVIEMLGLELLSGETLVIDTRTGMKLAYKVLPSGEKQNAWQYITGRSRLFPILPGSNYVNVSMQATTGETSITVTFTELFNMP